MTTSRTADIVWGTLGLLSLCLVTVLICAIFKADPQAYTAIGLIAGAACGGGGIGSYAVGMRHAGAKEPGSSSVPHA